VVSVFLSLHSQLCTGLDARVRAFHERRFDGLKFPWMMVDAMFITCRDDDRVVSRAALTLSGMRDDGCREILGVQIGDTESFATWEETFRWIKARGLTGVIYVISDQHAGLVEAAKKHFQGTTWQRCQVHFMRNRLLRASPPQSRCRSSEVGFTSTRYAEARHRLNEFIEEFASKVPKPVHCLEEAFEDARAVMVLPDTYRKRLRTTNMQERLNEEIRRRQRVIRIFPNDDSALR